MADLGVGVEGQRPLVDLQRRELGLQHLQRARRRRRTSRSRRPGRPRASRRSASPSWRRPGRSAASSSGPRSRPARRAPARRSGRRRCGTAVRSAGRSDRCRAVRSPDSGVPNVGEPDCMSMFDRNDPKITGRPAGSAATSAMPDSASAICCTSAAGMVTGDIAPIRMNGVSTTGCVGLGVLELRVEHPVVPAQRRVAVDQRDRRRASARSTSRPPKRIAPIAIVSAALTPETTLPM